MSVSQKAPLTSALPHAPSRRGWTWNFAQKSFTNWDTRSMHYACTVGTVVGSWSKQCREQNQRYGSTLKVRKYFRKYCTRMYLRTAYVYSCTRTVHFRTSRRLEIKHTLPYNFRKGWLHFMIMVRNSQRVIHGRGAGIGDPVRYCLNIFLWIE